MKYEKELEEGWQFSSEILGADLASHLSADYVRQVENAITDLEHNINDHDYRNLGVNQFQGYVLEEWSAGTFNVDAVAARSMDCAKVQHSLEKDSADIVLKSGKQISAKSYANAKNSVNEQAGLNHKTGEMRYKDMDRLVPSNQLKEGKKFAHRQSLRNSLTRKKSAEAYAVTERKLTDTVHNDEGIISKSATRKELNQMAKEGKNQKFEAKKHGVSLDSAISRDYLMKEALKSGYSAAVVTMTLQLTPEILKAVDYLNKKGEFDIQMIKETGLDMIDAGSLAFLRGSISSALLIMCKKGAFGKAFKAINPTLLGTTVAIVMETIKNSVNVAAGKMSAKEMGDDFAKMSACILGIEAGGLIGQALFMGFPIVGYLLGSLTGTAFCVAYGFTKKKLISFCVDTGFTCFGLVEQDYVIPDQVLNEIGIETITVPHVQVPRVKVTHATRSNGNIDNAKYETVQMTVLRRGLISVSKVGYIPTI